MLQNALSLILIYFCSILFIFSCLTRETKESQYTLQ